MEEILNQIKRADLQELDSILRAVEARYKILAPDWEVAYLALPRNDLQKQEKQLELAVEFLRKHYTAMS